MLDEKTREAESPASLKQCKWRNILFDEAGKGWNGITLFDSREAAEARMQGVLRQSEQCKKEKGNPGRTETRDGWFLMETYSWHMQIPILGASE